MKTPRFLSFPPLAASLGAIALATAPAKPTESIPTFNLPSSPMLPAHPVKPSGEKIPPPKPSAGANLPARFPTEFRSITGVGTNPAHPLWGSAGTPFLRVAPPAYADGKDAPAGDNRASARLVSNLVAAQADSRPSGRGASAMVWQWGQFLDHDLDLSSVAAPAEAFDIPVPAGDVWFDPGRTGLASITLDRTLYGRDANGVRQQTNDLTAFIDGNQIYGVDEGRAKALRTLDGTGRMKTSAGNLLPFNVDGLSNVPAPTANFFVAGDVRVNEQVGLIAIQTLFLREHNHWADYFHAKDPSLTDEQVYLSARAIVGAEIQAITYREFLPVLLGAGWAAPYAGYRPEVDPGITNEFAAAAYRVGHTMLSPTLLRLDADGTESAGGPLSLAASFFNVNEITTNGIEPLLSGLAAQVGQEVDNYLVDEVRNFLFGAPGSPGFDLASLNIQRGRDHGLPGYHATRTQLGLPAFKGFADVPTDETTRQNLAKAYASVDDIDLWVGGLAERHVPGAMVGETFARILGDQFRRVRDGDRFWYQGYLPPEWVRCVEQQTLAAIIRRNAVSGDWKIADNAFVATGVTPKPTPARPTAKPTPKPGPAKKKAPGKGARN